MLEIRELVAEYRDGAVRGLSLTVSDKGIFGILCAHAGDKTALAHVVCGCVDKTSGEVLISGEHVSRGAIQVRKRIRLVPRTLEMDGMSTPVEYLEFVADALGVDTEKKYRQVSEALELLGLDEDGRRPFFSLNSAERCRLSIAASLIGNPECIVIDDAFSGIGQNTLTEIFELLRMLARKKTVILLSHKPAEVKQLCENIAIMSGGTVAIEGSISDIEKKINGTREFNITARGEAEKIVEALENIDNVVGVRVTATSANKVNTVSIEHYPDSNFKDKVFAALAEINSQMLSFKEVKLTIDDVYYSLTLSDAKRAEAAATQTAQKKTGKKRVFAGGNKK